MPAASTIRFTARAKRQYSKTIENTFPCRLSSPFDTFNRELTDRVHPADWINPFPNCLYDLIVVHSRGAALPTPPSVVPLLLSV